MPVAALLATLASLTSLHACGAGESGGPTCCRCIYASADCVGSPCVTTGLESTVRSEDGLGDSCEQVCEEEQASTTESVDCSDEE